MKKAIRIEMTEYGEPGVLKAVERAVDSPGPGEVIVEVIAAAVNRADCEIRSGKWPVQSERPFPYVPGLELVGRVVGSGKLVTTMMQKLGGIHGLRAGGYQRYAKVPENTLADLPEGISSHDFAAVGLAGVTAYHGISKLFLKKGDRVVVQGVPGGVGSMALQMAKAKGAYVITPTRKAERRAELLALGADEVWVTYEKKKVDAVFEMVGGKTFGDCVAALKPGGRLCTVGALTGGAAEFSIWDLLHELELTGWSSEDLDRRGLQRAVDELGRMLRASEITVPAVKTFPLEEAAAAHREMESGAGSGRYLLI